MDASGTGSSRSFTPRVTMASICLLAILTSGFAMKTDAAGTVVSIKNFQFAPSPVTIAPGQTVTWLNKDAVDHWVAPDAGTTKFAPSPRIPPGGKYTVKFQTIGMYGYHDALNPFMTGTIFVKRAPAATPKPTPRPTARPTAKPTTRPTAKPTPKPTAKAAASPNTTNSVSPTDSPAAIARVSIGPDSSTSGGGLGLAPGPGSGESANASSGLLGVVAILGLVGVAFLAGIGIALTRRGRAAPLSDGAAAAIPGTPAASVPNAITTAPTVPHPPAQRRRPVDGQPRRVERAAPESPSFPDDVDEDAPIASSRPGARFEDAPPDGRL